MVRTESCTQVCEIQALSGGHFLWQSPETDALDVMSLQNVKRIGGNHVTMGDHRVWTNGGVISRRIVEEKERQAWRISPGIKSTHQNLCGQVFKQVKNEQLGRRELNGDLDNRTPAQMDSL